MPAQCPGPYPNSCHRFIGVEQRVAATQTLLAASPLVARISGESWRDCRIVAAHPLLDDRALAERLWEMSDRMLRGSFGQRRPRGTFNSTNRNGFNNG
jgi:hypothetical protein